MDGETKAAIEDSIVSGDVTSVRRLLTERPHLTKCYYGPFTWLHTAAHANSVPVAKLLIELGCDVNATQNNPMKLIPLEIAIGEDNVSMARLFLEHGADPNHGRPVVGAIVGPKMNSLEMVKLLEEFGADIHRVFVHEYTRMPMNALSSAIDWDKPNVAEYLRCKGAVLPGK